MEGRGGRREQSVAVWRPKIQKGWVTKMSRLHREEPLRKGQPSLWTVEFKIEDGACQPYSVTGRDCGLLGESGGPL